MVDMHGAPFLPSVKRGDPTTHFRADIQETGGRPDWMQRKRLPHAHLGKRHNVALNATL
jgi:hypothetical protein